MASIDCRVDALVPGIAWHSLETALYRNETVKLGWATTLRAGAGGAQVDKVEVPTLFLQGTVDTLFAPGEALTNYRSTERQPPCRPRPPAHPRSRSSPTSAFETVDQDGTSWSADFYPDTIEETLTATGEGTLALTEASVAGPAEVPATNTDVLGGLDYRFPDDRVVEIGQRLDL